MIWVVSSGLDFKNQFLNFVWKNKNDFLQFFWWSGEKNKTILMFFTSSFSDYENSA